MAMMKLERLLDKNYEYYTDRHKRILSINTRNLVLYKRIYESFKDLVLWKYKDRVEKLTASELDYLWCSAIPIKYDSDMPREEYIGNKYTDAMEIRMVMALEMIEHSLYLPLKRFYDNYQTLTGFEGDGFLKLVRTDSRLAFDLHMKILGYGTSDEPSDLILQCLDRDWRPSMSSAENMLQGRCFKAGTFHIIDGERIPYSYKSDVLYFTRHLLGIKISTVKIRGINNTYREESAIVFNDSNFEDLDALKRKIYKTPWFDKVMEAFELIDGPYMCAARKAYGVDIRSLRKAVGSFSKDESTALKKSNVLLGIAGELRDYSNDKQIRKTTNVFGFQGSELTEEWFDGLDLNSPLPIVIEDVPDSETFDPVILNYESWILDKILELDQRAIEYRRSHDCMAEKTLAGIRDLPILQKDMDPGCTSSYADLNSQYRPWDVALNPYKTLAYYMNKDEDIDVDILKDWRWLPSMNLQSFHYNESITTTYRNTMEDKWTRDEKMRMQMKKVVDDMLALPDDLLSLMGYAGNLAVANVVPRYTDCWNPYDLLSWLHEILSSGDRDRIIRLASWYIARRLLFRCVHDHYYRTFKALLPKTVETVGGLRIDYCKPDYFIKRFTRKATVPCQMDYVDDGKVSSEIVFKEHPFEMRTYGMGIADLKPEQLELFRKINWDDDLVFKFDYDDVKDAWEEATSVLEAGAEGKSPFLV